jgi:hypothetical protein
VQLHALLESSTFRHPDAAVRIPIPVLLSLTLLACAGGSRYNPTTVEAQYDERVLDQGAYSTLVIASINLGTPSRNYLEEHEARIDERVRAYLEQHGYRFVDSRLFAEAFAEGVRKYGEPYDRDTGRVNERSLAAALKETADSLRASGEVDAILFTDLVETQQFFSAGITRLARFHGVVRKPSSQGNTQGVPVDFNWAQPVDAVSLVVNLYDLDLQRLFYGVGGLELTEALDSRGGAVRFARRRNVLDNEREIDEGIELAFHPLVRMADWPGEER